jgi:chemotaxis protein CheX
MNPAQNSGTQTREAWAPLLELAVREVFEIMLGAQLGRPPEPAGVTASQITAMVGLAGHICGILTLRCSAHAATCMASSMLGSEVSESDEQMWDAVGEICNMVAGNFKNKLTGLADSCMLSVPTVITGGDYSFRALADGGSIEVVLTFDGEPISVALEVHS